MKQAGIFIGVWIACGCTLLKAQAPEVLVEEGVHCYALKEPKVFWHTASGCIPPSGEFPGANLDKPEILSRIATAGGTIRELLRENEARPATACNPYQFHSNIIADDDFVYWVDPDGLVRLSTSANVGDPPELMSSTITGNQETRRIELIQDTDSIYARTYDGLNSRIYQVSKDTGSAALKTSISSAKATKLSTDGKYVYWLQGSNLRRVRYAGQFPLILTIASGVTAYYAEGARKNIFTGTTTEYVFIGQGRNLVRYDNVTGDTSAPLYTSGNTTAVIYSMTSIGGGSLVIIGAPSGVFFLERRTITNPVPPNFQYYDQALFRIGRGGGTPDLLYYKAGDIPVTVNVDELTHNGTYLFWKDEERVLRHPANAEGLPQTNLIATRLEVTQGIQNTQNQVRLIEDRRTFVRFHVRSGDPEVSVPGVYAELRGMWRGGAGGPLAPVNSVGQRITVHPDPDRNDINQSFLFEIPLSWTRQQELRIIGLLNPYKLPLEDNYNDNVEVVGPFEFDPSPRLEVQFIAFIHEVGGTEYQPDYFDDVLATFSWMRRVYPLSSIPGNYPDDRPGFRPSLWYIFDDGLGARVDRTHEDCLEIEEEYRSLCASAYTNSLMAAWRAENGDTKFYYGMIEDKPKFPRGQAGNMVSSGPAGRSCCGCSGWDKDSTCADWYAGHEIGHTLGRGHPSEASDDPATENVKEGCGHDAADFDYPYADALIGPANGHFTGFDVGDSTIKPAVYPSSIWADFMSYCPYLWISDYTYNALYDKMMEGGGGALPGGGEFAAKLNGDWLSIFGIIWPESEKATIHYIRRISEVVKPSSPTPGGYAIELIDSQGNELALYPFSAQPIQDGESALRFGEVVEFVEGTHEVRVIRTKDDSLLARKTLSEHPPVVGDAEIQGLKGPATGFLPLNWKASDSDGDTLTFDILCSYNGGISFRPLYWNLKGSSTPVDMDELPGGNAILRVVGTDGVQSARADTAQFPVAPKPPRPIILSPSDGTRIQYGQLVTFIGEATDLQDGSIPESGLGWIRNRAFRPTPGSTFSMDTLPVGESTIVFRATNSLGLSAETEVTVIVHDDLRVPGPVLSVGPSQVGFHVLNPDAGPATAELTISNAGGGTLQWIAEQEASWLELSASGGTAPEAITLSADPSGLEPGGTYAVDLLISQDGNSEEMVTVLVTLVIGCSYCEDPAKREVFIRGDVDENGKLELTDVIRFLNFQFVGGEVEIHCKDAADVDDNGFLELTDAIRSLNFQFTGTASAPEPPGPRECGPDLNDDEFPDCEYPEDRCK